MAYAFCIRKEGRSKRDNRCPGRTGSIARGLPPAGMADPELPSRRKAPGYAACWFDRAMKNPYYTTAKVPVVLTAALGLFLVACDVDKTEDGELPDVNVNVPDAAV